MPFRAIGAEYFILRTLPAVTSLNPIILVVGDGRNLLRLWLRTKTRVLRPDLLHLLLIGLLFRPCRSISLSLFSRNISLSRLSHLMGGGRHSRSSIYGRSCWSRGCFRRMFLHPFLMSFATGRRTACRLTGNISFLRSGRFLMGLVPLSRDWFVRRSVLPHRRRVRLGHIRIGLWLGCLRLFSALLFLLSW